MVQLFEIMGILDYFVIGGVALWGLYCAVVVMTRVSSKRFKSEDAQDEFLDTVCHLFPKVNSTWSPRFAKQQ